jgi:adenylate cyclase
VGKSPPRSGNEGEGRIEIERTYLLDGLPALPASAEVLHIEQGYLPEQVETAEEGRDRISGGRIRRAVSSDGSVRITHTIKTGRGLLRTEVERSITATQFERYWPQTAGRRLRKTRYRVPDASGAAEVVWEIDAFEEFDLVLADVELRSADQEIVFPDWLSLHIVREVTEDASYRNYSLAVHGLSGGKTAGEASGEEQNAAG